MGLICLKIDFRYKILTYQCQTRTQRLKIDQCGNFHVNFTRFWVRDNFRPNFDFNGLEMIDLNLQCQMYFVFPFYFLVTTGYLVDNSGYLVVTSGYVITTTGYFFLLLVSSGYFSLLLVPRFSNNTRRY